MEKVLPPACMLSAGLDRLCRNLGVVHSCGCSKELIIQRVKLSQRLTWQHLTAASIGGKCWNCGIRSSDRLSLCSLITSLHADLSRICDFEQDSNLGSSWLKYKLSRDSAALSASPLSCIIPCTGRVFLILPCVKTTKVTNFDHHFLFLPS
jgi:hypothetical protein